MSFISRVNSSTELAGVPIDADQAQELAGMTPITATPAALAAGAAIGGGLITAVAAGAAIGEAVD